MHSKLSTTAELLGLAVLAVGLGMLAPWLGVAAAGVGLVLVGALLDLAATPTPADDDPEGDAA